MVNRTLLASAVLCTTLHLCALIAAPPHPVYAAFLLTACATSIWNHGTTSTVARIADRAVMVAGVPLTAALHPRVATWPTLAALSVSYAAAKCTGTVAPHIVAHALITALNLGILGVY